MSTKPTPSRAGKRAGRKQVFGDKLARVRLLTLISVGVSLADACKYLNVTDQTVRNARKRDPRFAAEYAKAMLTAKVEAVRTIHRASKRHATIALAYLGRRYPDEWAPRKPDAVTPAQMAALIDAFVATLVAEVPREWHGTISAAAAKCLSGAMSLSSPQKGDDDE